MNEPHDVRIVLEKDGHGRVMLDGNELRSVRSLQVFCNAGELPTVALILAAGLIEIETVADVSLNFEDEERELG